MTLSEFDRSSQDFQCLLGHFSDVAKLLENPARYGGTYYRYEDVPFGDQRRKPDFTSRSTSTYQKQY
jgi:hypothetical protein